MINRNMDLIIEGLHIDEAKTKDKSKTKLSELKKGEVVLVFGDTGDYTIKTAGKKYKLVPVNPDDYDNISTVEIQFFRPDNVKVEWSDKVDKYIVYK